MLVPVGLSKKERAKSDDRNVPKAKKFVNVGPKAGLRPVGGDKKDGTKTTGQKREGKQTKTSK